MIDGDRSKTRRSSPQKIKDGDRHGSMPMEESIDWLCADEGKSHHVECEPLVYEFEVQVDRSWRAIEVLRASIALKRRRSRGSSVNQRRSIQQQRGLSTSIEEDRYGCNECHKRRRIRL